MVDTEVASESAITTDWYQRISNAEIMINHAVRRGIEVPLDILEVLSGCREALFQNQLLDDKAYSSVVAACAKLAKLIAPATVESIEFTRSRDSQGFSPPKRLARTYTFWGLGIFVLLIIMQGYWLVLNGIVDDANRSREALAPYATLMVASWAELRAVNQTNAMRTPQPQGSLPSTSSSGETQATSPTTTDIEPSGDKVRDLLITKLQLIEAKKTEPPATGANAPVNVSSSKILTVHELFYLKNTLDTDLTFICYLAVPTPAACTSRDEGDFSQYNRSFGLSLEDLQNFTEAQYVLQIGTRFILPVVYGLLGAAVFLVRRISQTYSLETLSPSSSMDFSLRFFLGGVSGLAISWFVTPDSAGNIAAGRTSSAVSVLSPLVLSFVAGYAVELLFSLIDRIVASFTDTGVRRS